MSEQRVPSIIKALGGATLTAGWLGYVLFITGRAPASPNSATGQVWPIANHGSTAYGTLVEYAPFALPLVLVGLGLVIGLL